MGTHPIFESDFDCLTDRFVLRKMSEMETSTLDESQVEAEDSSRASYEEQVKLVNAISTPLASKKLTKRLFKCAKKASKEKTNGLRRGVKDVLKFIKKGEKGLAVLAGDTYPIDVYSHLPVVFENNDIPYVFVPSKHDLGASIGSKRPTCVLLIKPNETYAPDLGKCLKEVTKLPTALTIA